MRDRPEVESHLVGHQRVSVVKQVDVAPGQWTVLLSREDRTGRLRETWWFLIAFYFPGSEMHRGTVSVE